MKLLILLLLPNSAFAQDWGRYATAPVPPPAVQVGMPVFAQPNIPVPPEHYPLPPPSWMLRWNPAVLSTYNALPTAAQKYQWLTREPPNPTIRGKP
mgnify:CR=1 FL=1